MHTHTQVPQRQPKYQYIPNDYMICTVITVLLCGFFSPLTLMFTIPAYLFARKVSRFLRLPSILLPSCPHTSYLIFTWNCFDYMPLNLQAVPTSNRYNYFVAIFTSLSLSSFSLSHPSFRLCTSCRVKCHWRLGISGRLEIREWWPPTSTSLLSSLPLLLQLWPLEWLLECTAQFTIVNFEIKIEFLDKKWQEILIQ